MRLLLVRHPAPEIAKGVCYGQLDVPLHQNSEGDILTIVESLRCCRVAKVWCSPSSRCLIPARAAAASTRARLQVDKRLQELYFGEWEGLRWADIPRSELDRWAADPLGFAPPGGETGLALLTRTSDLTRTIIEEAVDCAVISHGGPLKILRALACGATPDLLAPPPPFGVIIALKVGHHAGEQCQHDGFRDH
jgi:alpha-ribazole phosphatase